MHFSNILEGQYTRQASGRHQMQQHQMFLPYRITPGQRRKWAVATGLDDHPKSVCTVKGADQVRLLTVLLKMQVC